MKQSIALQLFYAEFMKLLSLAIRVCSIQNLYTRRISNSNYGGATLTHENLSPRKFNPRNNVTTKICTFTVHKILKVNFVCCLSCFTGAFYPGVPIQPVVIKFVDNRLVSIAQLYSTVIFHVQCLMLDSTPA